MSAREIGKTIGVWASIATIIGMCIAAVALIPEFGQWLSPREPYIPTVDDVSSQETNEAGLFSPTSQPTQKPQDLWQFYVDDIKSTIPDATVSPDTLKDIAGKIPSDVPFLAEADVGLIPYQYTWKIIDREGPLSLNAPEGGYAFVAWGNGSIRANEFYTEFQAIEDNAYLVLVIGKSSDGTSADLNTPLELSDFTPGFSGCNFASPAKGQVFPERRVVNKAWLSQQLWWAASHNLITVSIWDVSIGQRLDYNVNPNDFMWSEK
jgi:hypothetical protein